MVLLGRLLLRRIIFDNGGTSRDAGFRVATDKDLRSGTKENESQLPKICLIMRTKSNKFYCIITAS